MYVIKKSDNYYWPISVDRPVNAGTKDSFTFDALFRRLSQSELDAYAIKAEKFVIRDIDIARDVLVGWKDVQNEQGEDMPFTTDTKEALLDQPMVASAIVNFYYESLAQGKRKN